MFKNQQSQSSADMSGQRKANSSIPLKFLIFQRRKKVSAYGLFWCREMKKRSNFKVMDLLN